jgi:pimeloyl-ACP methyl ester carboxylesterase
MDFRNAISASLGIVSALFLAIVPLHAASEGARLLVKSDGSDIEAFVFGNGAETLILAAGNGRPASQLNDLAAGVAASGIRVVTYNYRTLGASTGAIDGLTLHDYANDLWRVADALGAEKIHLAGKTYGNRVVRAASHDRPDRVLSVILIGAGGDIMPDAETIALYKRYVDPRTPKDEWLNLQGQLMYAPGNEHFAALDAAEGEHPALAAAQVKASDATPKAEWAEGGTAPMLVMTCLLDRVAVPESALSIAKSRPNTWLVGLPGCGHNMLNERGPALIRLMSEFIVRTSKQ